MSWEGHPSGSEREASILMMESVVAIAAIALLVGIYVNLRYRK
jgi:hypothetical protein